MMIGGDALRIWAYVNDVELTQEPEVDSDLILSADPLPLAVIERRLLIYSCVSCAVLAVGSLGPWRAGPLPDPTHNSGDGAIALLGAVFAALAIWRWTASRRRAILIGAWVVAAVCVAFGLLAAGVNYAEEISPGWGLILTLIAASALVVLRARLYRSVHAGEGWSSFDWS